MWHGYYYGFWWMPIFGILFFGSIVALIVWGLRRGTGRIDVDDLHQYKKTPMEYLKERYAKGEVSKEEYEEIKRDLLD